MAYQLKSYRKFLATSLTAAMVTTAVTPTISLAASPFRDVPEGTPYTEPINALAKAGVLKGFKDGTFRIRQHVTRAEAAHILTLLRGFDISAPAALFGDIKQGVWYSKGLNAAYKASVITGKKNGKFEPNVSLTRAEFALMLMKAYGINPKKDARNPFSDVKSGAWYTEAITTLAADGVIKGKTATTFAPNDPIDRGDLAILLYNAERIYGNKNQNSNGSNISQETLITLEYSEIVFIRGIDISKKEIIFLNKDNKYSYVNAKFKDHTGIIRIEDFEQRVKQALETGNLIEVIYEVDKSGNVTIFIKEETSSIEAYLIDVVNSSLKIDFEHLTIGQTFSLPTSIDNGITLSWTSKDQEIIRINDNEAEVRKAGSTVIKIQIIIAILTYPYSPTGCIKIIEIPVRIDTNTPEKFQALIDEAGIMLEKLYSYKNSEVYVRLYNAKNKALDAKWLHNDNDMTKAYDELKDALAAANELITAENHARLALKNKIQEIEALKGDYEEAIWKAFASGALKTAADLVANNRATKEELEKGLSELEAAFGKLNAKFPEIDHDKILIGVSRSDTKISEGKITISFDSHTQFQIEGVLVPENGAIADAFGTGKKADVKKSRFPLVTITMEDNTDLSAVRNKTLEFTVLIKPNDYKETKIPVVVSIDDSGNVKVDKVKLP